MSMNGFMKRLILSFIVLIGVYTLVRNNVYKIPDQIIWITSHDFLHKTLLPILMITSAIFSILKTDKPAYFNLAIGAVAIDVACRFYVGVNHLYGYLYYRNYTPPPTPPGWTKVVINLWPSHIILLIEILLIVIAWRRFIDKRQSVQDNNS